MSRISKGSVDAKRIGIISSLNARCSVLMKQEPIRRTVLPWAHQFFIVHVPLHFLAHSPREVDMIENLDLQGCLEPLILFLIHAFVVGLRPDVLCASVHHNEDEILKKARIRIPERAIAFIYCVMLSIVK